MHNQLRGRWNRECWHRETRQRGNKSNRSVRVRTVEQRGPREVLDGLKMKICHSVKYWTTCDALHPPQDRHLSFADLEAATYKRHRRAQPVLPTSSGEADFAVSNSRYAQLEDSDFCRGVADAGDLRLSWRLTPSWNCCRRRRSCTLTQRSKWSRRFIIGRLLFVPFVGLAFPVCYALMSRKTTELYVKVFQEIQQLVPQFAPTCAVADFEEASVAGFQHVYSDAGVAGCWFHCVASNDQNCPPLMARCQVSRCPLPLMV